MFCLQCGKDIGDISKNRICPYCGTEQYEAPRSSIAINLQQGEKKSLLYDFSDEEILALGLYPKDETYKMSLISRILGRR